MSNQSSNAGPSSRDADGRNAVGSDEIDDIEEREDRVEGEGREDQKDAREAGSDGYPASKETPDSRSGFNRKS